MRFGSVSFFKSSIKIALFYVLPACLALLMGLSVLHICSLRCFKREINALEEQIAALRSDGCTLPETDPADSIVQEQASQADTDDDKLSMAAIKELNKTASLLIVAEQTARLVPDLPDNKLHLTPPTVAADGPEPSAKPLLSTEYAHILPHFCQPLPTARPDHGRVAYMTFDDGPSARTLEILDILNQYGVKATFFVVNQSNKNLAGILDQMTAAGHAIGMHTATHDFKTIYVSVEAFLADIEANYQFIYEHTGIYPRIFRFAGGSANSYSRQTGEAIRTEMKARGFVYFDWNCATMDATRPLPKADEIVDNVLATSRDRDRIIILAHDSNSKHETVKALPRIIETLKERGYRFATLSEESEPIAFR